MTSRWTRGAQPESTRDAVLARLREGVALSGEQLAGELGVSRVAVSKHVAALKAVGYEIEAVPGSGYRLLAAPDAPLPAEVSRWLDSDLWTELHGGGETGSTNDDARVLARQDAGQGTVVLAARQLAGKGRLGRVWDSPSGGVYISAVLRPQAAPADVSALALVVSLGVARGLDRLGVRAMLKWPNDLHLEGADGRLGKLAGVLLEMSAESDMVDWVVAGVGINVKRPANAPEQAVYLSDRGVDALTAQVAAHALDGLAEAYEQWQRAGFDSLIAEYERRATLTGRDVVVRGMGGDVLAAGTVRGVDGLGRLLVAEEAGAIRAVAAGDVTLRDPAE